MQILCNRCIRGIERLGERLFIGEIIEDTRESCFWCEATDTDLFKVVFTASIYGYDEVKEVNHSKQQ